MALISFICYVSFPVSLWQTRSADLVEERCVLHLPVRHLIPSPQFPLVDTDAKSRSIEKL